MNMGGEGGERGGGEGGGAKSKCATFKTRILVTVQTNKNMILGFLIFGFWDFGFWDCGFGIVGFTFAGTFTVFLGGSRGLPGSPF